MKYTGRRLLLTALVALSVNAEVHAGPKSIADVATDPKDVAKKVWFGPAASQLKQLHNIGLPAIKEAFAAQGIEILTPLEFLDTPEKIEAYMNFELPKGGFQKFAEATLSWVDKSPHVTGAAAARQSSTLTSPPSTTTR